MKRANPTEEDFKNFIKNSYLEMVSLRLPQEEIKYLVPRITTSSEIPCIDCKDNKATFTETRTSHETIVHNLTVIGPELVDNLTPSEKIIWIELYRQGHILPLYKKVPHYSGFILLRLNQEGTLYTSDWGEDIVEHVV